MKTINREIMTNKGDAKKELALLEQKLNTIYEVNFSDPDNNGLFGTDGSHEELLQLYTRAFDTVEFITHKALSLLKEVLKDE